MTRRLTLALIVAVAMALALAGVGTLVLAGLGDRRDARARLESQADDTAELIGFLGTRAPGALPAIRRSLQVDGVVIAPFDRADARAGSVAWLPEGLTLGSSRSAALAAGEAVSWVDGTTIVAAAVVPRRASAQVVVVQSEVPVVPRNLTRWLALASLLALGLAAGGGVVLARRVTRPLRSLDDAAQRIAAGDLTTRVDVPVTNDELADLARSVNGMSAALQRSRDHERSFLLSISHDLRTPLTSIRGYAEAIADGAAADDQRAATVILSESRRLERLVADLLELAHLDAQRFSLRPVDADIAEIVEEAAEAFRPAFEEAGVGLDVAVTGPLRAIVDPDRLGQVVANLVENALKHADRSVQVVARSTSDAQRIEVVDDGAGIPHDERDRVFDRLYAGQRVSLRQVGSGLGLAIVAELVEAMGGAVRCTSTAGGGTTMSVEVPRPT